MYFLTKELYFPSVEETTEEGILAVGGDLSTERLMLAYNSGIFPWFEDDEPILWWSPNPRMVLFPENFKLPNIAISHLYKQAGNSVSVPVINKIAENILKVMNGIDVRKSKELELF